MLVTLNTALPWNRSCASGSVFRAAVSLIAAGAIVKAFAILKEVTIAGTYGRNDAMDALVAAALIPALLVNLITESLNQAFVPTLIRVQEQEGKDAAQQLFSNSMFWMCLLLTTVSLGMALGGRELFPLIASHYPEAKLDLAVRMFYALLPLVLITGIATHCNAVLNTLDRFVVPALAPILISVLMIAAVLLFGGQWGIWAVVYGNLAGALIHALVIVRMLHEHGYKIRLSWVRSSPAAREVASRYVPVFLSSIVASGGLLVDQAMAATLPAGSVSALAYANRFVSVVITLLAGAVSTAIMPHFSHMVVQRNWGQCRRSLRTWLSLTALVSVPLTIALIAGAHSLIRVTLQHGAFDTQDTAVVTSVLIMYSIQVPFYVCSRVSYRFLLSMLRTDLIFYCGALNLILDVVLNLVLMRILGIAGIALATSLWNVSTFLFLFYWSRKLLRRASREWPQTDAATCPEGSLLP
jgi:putative peptidoglycan lipid II flippase